MQSNTKLPNRETVENAIGTDGEMELSVKSLGEFQLLQKLGEGAMGTVYKAFQPSFDRTVALKVLFRSMANNPRLVERLYREALVLGRLDHPNIVRGYGVGEEHGWHYFAMEFIDGKSLQAILNRFGTLPLGDALHIAIACARGLQYAHDNDLIHRDIKPDNVLITRQGQVKIADLGMVKHLDENMALTQTGHAVGTPWFMPLEQARNAKDADGRCDIYALGCLLYALITGNPPFRGATIVDVIRAKEVGTFAPARRHNSDVPERLDLIIAKMTAKYPSHRYRNCAQLIADLESVGLANTKLSFLHRKHNGANPQSVEKSAGSNPETKFLASLSDSWFIRFENERGKLVVRKVTEQQVVELLQKDQLDPTAQASRTSSKDFRSLATYKEFRNLVLTRLSKKDADERSTRYRNLYKKAEQEDRDLENADAQNHANLEFWISVAIKIGAVLGAIGVLIAIFILLGKSLDG